MSAQPEPMTVTVQVVTDPRFADEVAAVAAATFPLACPPHSAPANIDAFIRDNLAPADFAEYIDAPESDVLLARTDDDIPVATPLCIIANPLMPTSPPSSPIDRPRRSPRSTCCPIIMRVDARSRRRGC